MDEAFAVSESMVPAATPEATLTVIVKLADTPDARLAIEQEMVPVAPTAGFMQVHPAAKVRELNVRFGGAAGRVSLSTTLFAVPGPLLMTVTVYEKVDGDATEYAEGVFVTAKFAESA